MKNRTASHSSAEESQLSSLERVKEILLADYTKLNERRLKELEEQFNQTIEKIVAQNQELNRSLSDFIKTELDKISSQNERRFKKMERVDKGLERKMDQVLGEISDLTKQIRNEKVDSKRMIDSLKIQISILENSGESDKTTLLNAIHKVTHDIKEQKNRISQEKETILKILTLRTDELAKELGLNRKNASKHLKEMEQKLNTEMDALMHRI